MVGSKLCISIRSLKRADYLKRCLTSLEKNVDLKGVDFFLFQDGAVNKFSGKRYATDKEVKESLKVFRQSKLPNKVVYKSEDNLGPAIRNKLQLEYFFPRYDYGVLLDNDLVFNKYYIKTLKVLFKQFENDRNAGVIQTSCRHPIAGFQTYKQAKATENKVSYGFSHYWEMGFWKKSWKQIKTYMQPYFHLIKNCDFYEFMYNYEVYKNTRERLYKIYGSYHMANDSTSEDYALSRAALRAGYRGIHTLALRHKTIGERGMYSFREARFKGGEYDKVKLYQVGDVGKYEIT
jgi:hypothetical protein